MPFKLSKEIIELLDKTSSSPNVIAGEVLEKLRVLDLDDYDLICFCISFLSAMSITKMQYIEPQMKMITYKHTYAHYLRLYESWKKISDMELINKEDITKPIQE